MRFLSLSLLLGVVAIAQPATVRGRTIVDQAVAAMGGPKFLGMENRVEQGRLYSFYREQLNGLATARVYTKYDKPGPDPISIRERQSFGKKEEDYAYLFTGKEGVQVNFRGIRPLPAGQYERYIDTTQRNIFYILRYRLDELGMIFEFKETAVFDNSPVEVVDITDGENRTVTVYFHRTTHLPIRQVFYRRDPESKRRIEEMTVYNKYRDAGGVKWPWSIVRFRDGNKIFEMYSESVSINEAKLDEKLFEPPSGAKRLKSE